MFEFVTAHCYYNRLLLQKIAITTDFWEIFWYVINSALLLSYSFNYQSVKLFLS
jgi:hypothetical protein